MLPVLRQVAAAHAGRLLVATILIDRGEFLATQYGVELSPTLAAFHGGDAQGGVQGFIPEGLVHLFAEDILRGSVTDHALWSPVEKDFEDTVLVPLLQRWQVAYQRQVSCRTGVGGKGRRGQVDFLLYSDAPAQPLSLIESKRQIRGEQDLQLAVRQAATYAASLMVPAFAVAAPRGMWIYRCDGARSVYVQHFTSLEMHLDPDRPKRRLLQPGP
jgi:hypothetical protein